MAGCHRQRSALRSRGELLLGEVTRAASFLRQIAVYGEQQTSALEPVNVTEVLRRLEPVLKRVAGDEIEFVLPKTARPLKVDVGAERSNESWSTLPDTRVSACRRAGG